MSRFVQGPRPVFNPQLNLRRSLLDLYHHEPTWPAREAMMKFARDDLKIPPAQEDEWYRAAWWGYYACRLMDWYRAQSGKQELLDLIEPIDWRPLDNLLQSGRGVIMAVAHLGLGGVLATAMNGTRYPTLAIRGGPAARNMKDSISVQDESDRK